MKNLLTLLCFCFCLTSYTQDASELKSTNASEREAYRARKKTLADSLRQIDSKELKMKFLDNEIALEKEKENPSNNYLAEVYHRYGGLYYNEDKFRKALKKYELALPLREDQTAFIYYELARTNYMLGVCNFEYGLFRQSIDYLKLAEKAYLAEEEIDNKDSTLNFKSFERSMAYLKTGSNNFQELKRWEKVFKTKVDMAKSYAELGEYSRAEGLFIDCIDYHLKVFGEDKKLAKIYNNIGNMILDQKEYTKAKKYYRKALSINQKNSFKINEADCLNNLGLVYLDEKKTTEALEYLNKALAIKKQLDDDDVQLSIAKSYENIGLCYKVDKKNDKALIWLSKAFHIRQEKIDPGKKNLALNKSYHNLGALYTDQGNYEKALNYLQKAIQQTVLNFNSDDSYTNPSLDQTNSLLGSQQNLLKDLQYKGIAFKQWYNKSQDLKYLEAAQTTFQLATQITENMRANFLGMDTKLSWLETTFPIFENAIAIHWELYQLQPSKKLFTEILILMEQNKAVLLLENLKVGRGIDKIGIPEAELNAYKKIVKEKEAKIKEQNELIGHPKQDSLLQQNEIELALIISKKAEFEEYFKENFPKFKKLTKNNYATIEEKLSKTLLPNQALIEYFVGDAMIYVAAMSNIGFSVNTISKTEVQIHIENLFNAIKTPQHLQANQKDSFKTFTQAAHQLYNLLLKEVLNDLDQNINQLLIVPDNIIANLPFDILLQDSVRIKKENYAREQLNYLIKDYTINYAYSGTHLSSFSHSPIENSLSFIGYAPNFNGMRNSVTASRACNSDTLSKLKHNQLEVKNIHEQINGDTILDAAATKASFLDQALKYDIIHLATHACAQADNSNGNRIYFAENGVLYSHELSNLDLKAKMVVLSACETGIGEFKKGEGTMSLARSFADTGIPSITMSLWSVNDAATAEIMTAYYKFLKEGQGKEEALRNAKLAYLDNQEELYKLHPLYWASFVHYGIADPIVKKSAWSYLDYAVVFFLLLVAIGGLFYFRKLV